MTRAFLSLCVATVALRVNAVEVSVDSTPFSIPAPAGFTPVTGDMKPYADVALRFVPPSNEQIALFLTDADAAVAAAGRIPANTRRCYVQVPREMIKPFVTTRDFAELKNAIKTQNETITKAIEAKMPGILKKISDDISSDHRAAFEISMTRVIPLPPHYESERCLAYSMILRYSVTGRDGRPSPVEGVGTVTLAHLRGKVLMLYVIAEKSGLEWSRTEAREWADSVIAENPSVGALADREAAGGPFHLDWNSVLRSAMVGGIIGAIFCLLRYLFGKVKG